MKLATDASLLGSIRRKLAQNRLSCPLFDTDRFRRHLEAAYLTAWEIYQRGEPPRSFSIGPHPPLQTMLILGSQGAAFL